MKPAPNPPEPVRTVPLIIAEEPEFVTGGIEGAVGCDEAAGELDDPLGAVGETSLLHAPETISAASAPTTKPLNMSSSRVCGQDQFERDR